MSDLYSFSTTDGGKTYSRYLFGLEAVACSFAEEDVFFYTGICSFQLPSPLDIDQILPAVRASWARLRYLAPTIAVTTSRLPNKTWVYQYDVPNSQESLDAWADETVFSHDNELDVEGRRLALAPRLWRPSSGRYAMELHIGPMSVNEGKWVFALHGPHATADGRIATALLEQLALFLKEELVEATPVPGWGSEWQRLTANATVLTGEFDNFMAAAAANPPVPPPAPPAGFVPFLPPPVYDPSAKGTSAARLIIFDAEQTRKIRVVCKSHGRTVTQFVDSVLALSHVESHLAEAKASGGERFDTVASLYEIATNWLVPLTFKDQRPHLEGYSSLKSPGGTSLFAIDGFSLLLDMGAIRKALAFDKETGKCARDASDDTFWNGVVSNYIEARGQQKFDLSSFIMRWTGFNMSLDTFSAQQLYMSALATSSIGDVEQLGLMHDLKPAPGKLGALQIMHSVNGDMPVTIAMYWQYDGKLNIHLHSGRSYHSDREMDGFASAFEGWVDALTA